MNVGAGSMTLFKTEMLLEERVMRRTRGELPEAQWLRPASGELTQCPALSGLVSDVDGGVLGWCMGRRGEHRGRRPGRLPW